MAFKPPNFRLTSHAATATGRFSLSSPRDQWLVDRTREWCGHYVSGDWQYRIDAQSGVITFSFSSKDDAQAFREATSASEDLITCN